MIKKKRGYQFGG